MFSLKEGKQESSDSDLQERKDVQTKTEVLFLKKSREEQAQVASNNIIPKTQKEHRLELAKHLIEKKQSTAQTNSSYPAPKYKFPHSNTKEDKHCDMKRHPSYTRNGVIYYPE